MVVQIGSSDPDGMQLRADNLQHRGPFWPSAESGLARTTGRGSCGPAAIIIKSDILTASISTQGPTKRPLAIAARHEGRGGGVRASPSATTGGGGTARLTSAALEGVAERAALRTARTIQLM